MGRRKIAPDTASRLERWMPWTHRDRPVVHRERLRPLVPKHTVAISDTSRRRPRIRSEAGVHI